MFVDTHCHLNFSQYDTDRAMVIGNAKKAGVKKFICPGTDLLSSKKAITLAEQHPGVIYAAIGFHPYEAQRDAGVRTLEKLIQTPFPPHHASRITHHAMIAIGECGLDYHMYGSEKAQGKKDAQKRLFSNQLELALKHHLPVIFHCRDAFEDFSDTLDTLTTMPRGVIHCFSGGLADLRMAQERKLFVGIDGNVTYSKHLQTFLPHIPLSLLLLETDAPYLTPVPHRGTRNEPKYIPLVAKKVAELKGISVRDVEQATTTNAQQLFQIS